MLTHLRCLSQKQMDPQLSPRIFRLARRSCCRQSPFARPFGTRNDGSCRWNAFAWCQLNGHGVFTDNKTSCQTISSWLTGMDVEWKPTGNNAYAGVSRASSETFGLVHALI